MSDTVTLTGGQSAMIYGTFAGAGTYLALQMGEAYDAFRALVPDDQKRALATATRNIDRRRWQDAVNTFALRDAAVDAETRPVFQLATYELAAAGALDPSVFSTVETGSNIKSAGAGSAHAEFFRPTSIAAGTARPLPDVVQQLIGSYLAGAGTSAVIGGYGQSGDCESNFDDEHELRLVWPP